MHVSGLKMNYIQSRKKINGDVLKYDQWLPSLEVGRKQGIDFLQSVVYC